jgi:hypothetical protein
MSKRKPPPETDNHYSCPFSIHAPPPASPQRVRLNKWLNVEHTGQPLATGDASSDHIDSHYNLAKHYQGFIHVQIGKDGRPIPMTLEVCGKTYALVEQLPKDRR